MSLLKYLVPSNFSNEQIPFSNFGGVAYRQDANRNIFIDTALTPIAPTNFTLVNDGTPLLKLRAPLHCQPGSVIEDARGNVHFVLLDGSVIVNVNAVNLGQLAAQGFASWQASGPSNQRPAITWSGMAYWDTSLNQQITRNATNTAWIGPCGAAT